jgi:hypothetical protein
MIQTSAAALDTRRIWLRSKEWDLFWITGSALLIALPITLYGFFKTDQARIVINLIVTLLIGGPHMYATATRTALEPRFVGRFRWQFFAAVVLIPAAVITLTLTSYVLLLTLFFSWAAVHILHQASYIAGRYNDRSPVQMSRWSRFLDYAVIFTSLYPIGLYKLVNGTFKVGPTKLYFPPFLQTPVVYYAAFVVFFTLLALFTIRTMREIRAGEANWPKILLVYTTAAGAFIVPAFRNLDTSFQGFNTWHSFQYMALTWHINTLRRQQGTIGGGFVRRLMDDPTPKRFYTFTILLTLAAGALIWCVYRFSGFTVDQSYYTVTLSFLLTHYCLDHFLFFAREDELKPAEELAAA